jgi:20S proteasome alpha/beta subunit
MGMTSIKYTRCPTIGKVKSNNNESSSFCNRRKQNLPHVLFRIFELIVPTMLVLWCYICSILRQVSASTTASSSSPVPHFTESLAASSSHGTIIAISCSADPDTCSSTNESCVVVVSHSPYKEEQEDNLLSASNNLLNENQEPIRHYGSITSSLHYLHSDLLLGMTGFVPDVNHLLRSFANTALLYEHVLSSSCSSSSSSSDVQPEQTTSTTTIPVKKLVVQGISRELRNAAMSNNGRPYGVQALVVGRKPKLTIYTVDSIGGWTHWGGGATAIGRYDQKVRVNLAAELKKRNNDIRQLTMDDAVKIALICMLKASSLSSSPRLTKAAATTQTTDEDSLEDHDSILSLSGQNFNAVVVFGSPQKSTVRLTPTYLASVYNKVMEDYKKGNKI